MKINPKHKFVKLWLIIALVTGFIAILFFRLLYLNNNVLCSLDCKSRNEVLISIVLLCLVGMFVGSLTYYFISDKYEKHINKLKDELKFVYDFMDHEQRIIFKKIIENDGNIKQSQLPKITGLNRLQVSREIKRLVSRGILIKKESGMTNEISLKPEIKKLFIK
jgi:hypothetical protein